MIDKLIVATMIIASILCTHYAAFEMGKREMCIKDKDYLWSFDFSKCIKIGKESYK